MEKGHGLTRDHNHQRPADLLVTGWDRGRLAAMGITVTSPLTPVILGSHAKWLVLPALVAENRKMQANSPKCQELGWACTPLAVLRNLWQLGGVCSRNILELASHLAISQSRPKALVVADIYGRLNLHLVKSIARALLARERNPS